MEPSAGTPHTRTCFYVSAQYEPDSPTSDSDTCHARIYVEHLVPAAGASSKPPLILIPGAAHTSACWVTTPDGRPGWSSFFLSHGHALYLLDPVFTGRSPWSPTFGSASSDAVLSTMPPTAVAHRWTAPAAHRAPWPQARLHTQWPHASSTSATSTGKAAGGEPGDPVFDAYAASLVALPHDVSEAAQQRAMRAAVVQLLAERVRAPAVLVAHSLGAARALPAVDAAAPSGRVRALVLLEPNGPPWSAQAVGGVRLERPWGFTEAEVRWEPPVTVEGDGGSGADAVKARFALRTESSSDPGRIDCVLQVEDADRGVAPRKLVNLVDVPIAVVTGEASHHAQYDWGTVRFFRQAGVRRVDHLELGEMGIHGNGHLFIVEKNSDEIADAVRRWLESLDEP